VQVAKKRLLLQGLSGYSELEKEMPVSARAGPETEAEDQEEGKPNEKREPREESRGHEIVSVRLLISFSDGTWLEGSRRK